MSVRALALLLTETMCAKSWPGPEILSAVERSRCACKVVASVASINALVTPTRFCFGFAARQNRKLGHCCFVVPSSVFRLSH